MRRSAAPLTTRRSPSTSAPSSRWTPTMTGVAAMATPRKTSRPTVSSSFCGAVSGRAIWVALGSNPNNPSAANAPMNIIDAQRGATRVARWRRRCCRPRPSPSAAMSIHSADRGGAVICTSRANAPRTPQSAMTTTNRFTCCARSWYGSTRLGQRTTSQSSPPSASATMVGVDDAAEAAADASSVAQNLRERGHEHQCVADGIEEIARGKCGVAGEEPDNGAQVDHNQGGQEHLPWASSSRWQCSEADHHGGYGAERHDEEVDVTPRRWQQQGRSRSG